MVDAVAEIDDQADHGPAHEHLPVFLEGLEEQGQARKRTQRTNYHCQRYTERTLQLGLGETQHHYAGAHGGEGEQGAHRHQFTQHAERDQPRQ